MFTLDQIKAAHQKVKSGADFPAFIRELKSFGVISYHTYVSDGHIMYVGLGNYERQSPAKYSSMTIADPADRDQFIQDLRTHQQGGSDYPTFCNQCAASGVDMWIVSLVEMTCSYYDKNGEQILVEAIPGG